MYQKVFQSFGKSQSGRCQKERIEEREVGEETRMTTMTTAMVLLLYGAVVVVVSLWFAHLSLFCVIPAFVFLQ